MKISVYQGVAIEGSAVIWVFKDWGTSRVIEIIEPLLQIAKSPGILNSWRDSSNLDWATSPCNFSLNNVKGYLPFSKSLFILILLHSLSELSRLLSTILELLIKILTKLQDGDHRGSICSLFKRIARDSLNGYSQVIAHKSSGGAEWKHTIVLSRQRWSGGMLLNRGRPLLGVTATFLRVCRCQVSGMLGMLVSERGGRAREIWKTFICCGPSVGASNMMIFAQGANCKLLEDIHPEIFTFDGLVENWIHFLLCIK